MMNNGELDEGPAIDFKGATLRIDSGDASNNSRREINLISSAANSNERNSHEIKPSSGDCDDVSTNIVPYNNQSNALALVSHDSTSHNSSIVPWWGEDIDDYFSNRTGLIEQAIDDCRKTTVSDEDGDFIGAWLLTEISSWDTEKERLVILTSMTVVTIKYDFIALKLLDYDKVLLNSIDTVIIGGLIYPNSSLIPRLNGLVSGVSGVVRGCVLQPLHERLTSQQQQERLSNPLQHTNFEPRSRNINGVRAMWNRGKDLSFVKKWNPFTKMPWTTYTSHPLLWCKGGNIEEKRLKMYNVDDFTENLVQVVEKINLRPTPCNVEHRPILLENYINLPSLIHNKNALGFFKVRGKFSF